MSSPGAVVRPGIARGGYPERSWVRENWLDRSASVVLGANARRHHGRRHRLERFVRSVERLGAGLAAESDERINGRVRHLHERLTLEGLTDDLIVCSFAIVREVARRTLGTPHYDVQLMGGRVMIRGMLAEMETGEGKTLTATLPACTAALAGIPVHVISVNDYLVARDAEAMRPIYEALGLSVGTVTDAKRDPASRRAAYACDVAYATSNQIAFDYLRDGIQRSQLRGGRPPQVERPDRDGAGADRLLLRGLCYAIVDEADSVLVDEARTPLILSGPPGSVDEPRTYRSGLKLAGALREGIHFRLDRREGGVQLTEQGRERLEELARPLGGVWTGPRRREEWVVRALGALHLFVRDQHYLVREGKVVIVDQPTGRAAPDRSWERGLHQLIELKEGCEVTPERETVARISYQRFFRRYLRLAGMTGTAREVASELWRVYRLNTVAIPTRLPLQRRALGTRVYATQESKWAAVVERVQEVHARGRPVLVGTCSVAASEHLSGLLAERGLPHRVLNARHHAREASIVAEAGGLGRITVATNMAGRGTDIRLGPGVVERGGLHVIATQRAEARRIDRQLLGRCGRQGDPGSYEAILSLEDESLRLFYPAGFLRFVARRGRGGAPIQDKLAQTLTRLPQYTEERRHVRLRRNLVDLEEYLGELLAFAGPGQ